MARWTREEEEKLLEMYATASSIKKMAEALNRSESSISNKLRWLREKGKITEITGPIYRGEKDAVTEEVSEAQQIYDALILALLNEFHKVRKTLHNLGQKYTKHKVGLYNNLCRIAETLISLLKVKPEKTNIQEWFDKIAIKNLPKEARREPRRVIQRWTNKSGKLSKSRRSSAV